MPVRHTPESLLVSALVNSHDATAHVQYGIGSEHFYGYRAEFDWVVSFSQRYGRTPSREEIATQFKTFPLASSDQDDVRWPAHQVLEEFATRQLSRALITSSGHLRDGQIEQAYQDLAGLDLKVQVERPSNLLDDPGYLDDYDKPIDKIRLPWSAPQGATDGIDRGELWIMAARPSQGKSQTLLEFACHAALVEARTIILYSLEMTQRQVQARVHAIMAHKLGIKVSHHAMSSRRFDALEYKHLLAQIAAEVPGRIDIHTPKDGPCTPAVIAARADDYELTLVDYVGLMRSDAAMRSVDDWRVAATISNSLKEIALSKDTRILAASQINRDGDSGNRPPKLKNLSQADAWAQDADVVMTMVRYGQGATMFSMEKNRNGASQFNWWTRFDPDAGDYRQITREDADDIRDQEEMTR
jgi:hypothetical protein